MHILEELGLATWESWPWWLVEVETAKLLMTYLASIISVMDERSPLTDDISTNTIEPFSLTGRPYDDKMEIRNRLLNDILPLPSKIKVSDLEKIKGKYAKELIRFRNNIENLILDLSRFEDARDFENRYKFQIAEIREAKEFITDKLSEPQFGKIVFGTLCSLTATGIAIAQAPNDQLYWTIPSILTAVYTAIESHRRNDIKERQPLSYLALIDRQLKIVH